MVKQNRLARLNDDGNTALKIEEPVITIFRNRKTHEIAYGYVLLPDGFKLLKDTNTVIEYIITNPNARIRASRLEARYND